MATPIVSLTHSERELHEYLPINVTKRANGGYSILCVARDGSYMLGTGPIQGRLYQSVLEGATGSWTILNAIVGGSNAINGAVPSEDGGMFVTGGAGTVKFSGASWGTTVASRAAATFSVVLTPPGGAWFDWNQTDDCIGSNGVVVAATYGGHTDANSDPTVTANVTAARYIYASTDYGNTFAMIFDLYATSPTNWANANTTAAGGNGNMHVHSACYDESNDRIWMTFGDAGQAAAYVGGSAYSKIGYCDNFRDAVSANDLTKAVWNFLPMPNNRAPTGLQNTAVHATKEAVLMTCDSGAGYLVFALPKTGYRTFGEPIYSGNNEGIGINIYRNFNRTTTQMMFAGSRTTGDGGRTAIQVSNNGGLTWNEFWSEPDLVTYPNLKFKTVTPFFGPLPSGKLIANLSGYSMFVECYLANGGLPIDPTKYTTFNASIVDGGTITHGMQLIPRRVLPTVATAGYVLTLTAKDATTLTFSLKDSTGAAVTVATPIVVKARP